MAYSIMHFVTDDHFCVRIFTTDDHFQIAMYLPVWLPRYGWPLKNSPSHCSCGQPSWTSIEHTLTCKTGGFPVVRHNHVRDITTMLHCHGVITEPHLQLLSASPCLIAWPLTKTVLDLMSQCMDSGEDHLFEKALVYVRAIKLSVMVPFHSYNILASMCKKRTGRQ